ncbi:calcium-binding protein [Streptomyces sp. NPDC093089]|uniref:calcium-binding protein n=1 Tax=Streptomyces sp. NPDC093089 TaxID=3366024 RepID=UPI0037F41FA1
MTHVHLRPAGRHRGAGGRAGALAACGLALALALPGTALAAPGDLDPAFGTGGRVTTPLPGYAEGHDLARQADGKLVMAGLSSDGGFALARYLPGGGLDTGFGGDGVVTSDFGGGAHTANAVAIQPSDGKIVVAGTTEVVAEEGGGCCFFSVARYNANGTPDAGFGTGGRTSVAFPGDGGTAYGMALQTNGEIVLAGRADDPASAEANDFGLARFHADGSVDTGFGGDGFAVTGFGDFDEARAVLVQPDGKIVAGGHGAGFAFSLARYQGGDGTPPPAPRADLVVTQAPTAPVSIGDRTTYTVTVANSAASTATATGVTLSDTLSGAGVTLTSATSSQGGCTTTATTATCALGSLAPGASAAVTLTAEPRSTGTITHTATASGSPQDPAAGNNMAVATTPVNNARGCTIIGTSNADTLTGGYANDVICALGGNDTVRAGYGNDTVHGGFGNDSTDGGFGDDTLNGGPGNDTLTGYYGNDRLTTTDGVQGNDTANGGLGTDTCTTDAGDTRISCP